MIGKAPEKWAEIGANLACDGYNGEVFLSSSLRVPTLEECKASCESAKGCKSMTYFSGTWCSHWGTPCERTKANKKAVMSLRLNLASDVGVGKVNLRGGTADLSSLMG